MTAPDLVEVSMKSLYPFNANRQCTDLTALVTELKDALLHVPAAARPSADSLPNRLVHLDPPKL